MLLDPILAVVRKLPLDNHQRSAAASLFHVQACGERIAMEGARAQATIAPTRKARRFLLRQSRQEAFHARLFARMSRAMAASVDTGENYASTDEPEREIPQSLQRVHDLLLDAVSRGAYAEAVVIQHIALEGLGIVVLELLDDELAAVGQRFSRFRCLVLAQEAAHFAFGAQVLDDHRHEAGQIPLVRRMLDEAERLLIHVAPQFRLLGGDVGDVIGQLRARTFAATGVAQL